jgi:hypothetical protein
MPYSAGIMLRATSYGIGTMAVVPLIVPVTCPGYCLTMGFGWDWVWQDRDTITATAAAAVDTTTSRLENEQKRISLSGVEIIDGGRGGAAVLRAGLCSSSSSSTVCGESAVEGQPASWNAPPFGSASHHHQPCTACSPLLFASALIDVMPHLSLQLPHIQHSRRRLS